MYDSVDITAIPRRAKLVAVYVDGHYANADAAARRFKRARFVRITVLGTTLEAHVCDCETGDLTPGTAARWAKAKNVKGDHPTIYCSESVVPSVVAECHKLGLNRGKDYSIWQAHYGVAPVLPKGCVALQYTDHGPRTPLHPLGAHYDLSVVAAYWPGVDPVPATTPAPNLPSKSASADLGQVAAIRNRLVRFRKAHPVWAKGAGFGAAVRHLRKLAGFLRKRS